MESFKTLIAQNEAELKKKRKTRFGEGSALPGGAGVAAILELQKQVEALGGGFATQADVQAAVAAREAAQAAADAAQDAAVAAQQAVQDAAVQANEDAIAANAAADAAEEAADVQQEADTDAEQATQDSAIASLQNAVNNLAASLATKVQSVTAGANITVDNSDPTNPVVSGQAGGGVANGGPLRSYQVFRSTSQTSSPGPIAFQFVIAPTVTDPLYTNPTASDLQVGETGRYLVSFNGGIDNASSLHNRLFSQIAVNGAIVNETNALGTEINGQGEPSGIGFNNTIILDLQAGDNLRFINNATQTYRVNNRSISVVRLEAVEGPEGPQGPAGADGMDGADGVDGTVADHQMTFDATDWQGSGPRTLTIPAGVHGLAYTAGELLSATVADTTGCQVGVLTKTDLATGDVTIETEGAAFDGIVRIF